MANNILYLVENQTLQEKLNETLKANIQSGQDSIPKSWQEQRDRLFNNEDSNKDSKENIESKTQETPQENTQETHEQAPQDSIESTHSQDTQHSQDSIESTNTHENIESKEDSNHIENLENTQEPHLEQTHDIQHDMQNEQPLEHLGTEETQDSINEHNEPEYIEPEYENELSNDIESNPVVNEINHIKQNIESNLKNTTKQTQETPKTENVESGESSMALGFVMLGLMFVAGYLFATRLLRIAKITFIVLYSMMIIDIWNNEGFGFNIFWVGVIWFGLASSIIYDFLYVKVAKTWEGGDYVKNLLRKNIRKFNVTFMIYFLFYATLYYEGAEHLAWLAFFAMIPLNIYYKRVEFIANTLKATQNFALGVDSKSYALVGNPQSKVGLFGSFSEKDLTKRLQILVNVVYVTLFELKNQGLINLQKLSDEYYIFGSEFYPSLMEYASNVAYNVDRITAKAAQEKLKYKINLDLLGVEDVFILTGKVQKCIFNTSEYYVHNSHLDKYIFCESCGNAEKRGNRSIFGAWYCSETCEYTEHTCMAVSDRLNPMRLENESESEYNARRKGQQDKFDRSVDAFLANNNNKGEVIREIISVIGIEYIGHDFSNTYYNADSNDDIESSEDSNVDRKSKKSQLEKSYNDGAIGAGTIGAGEIWNQNKSVTGTGTGHGVVAEHMNTQRDLELGRDAKNLGGDNAKHGPDRMVNGELIQTKYCATAKASVNAGFENNGSGDYKYFGEDGKPMQLEVPSDQFDEAIEEMKQKIIDGKVPGVTDPNEATKLVRKGHFTYDEVKNEAKFGIKTLKYDIKTSAITAGIAGGISFVMNVAICYYRNGNAKEAIRESFIIGLKTSGKTFAITLLVGQAQKWDLIAKGLEKAINFKFDSGVSKFIGENIAKTAGKKVDNIASVANNKLRATAVTAVATIAVTSSIQLIQMARGRISGMQCLKNITHTTGATIGGAVGAVMGASIGSFIPVVGTFIGGFVGGMAGGMLGGGLMNILTSGIEDDISKKYRIFYGHMSRLAVLFKLSDKEMDEFSNLVNSIIKADKNFFNSKEFTASEMLPYSNSVLKPLVVMIVSRRPALPSELLNEQYINEVITEEINEIQTSA